MKLLVVAALGTVAISGSAQAANLVDGYSFNNTLASSQPGGQSLGLIDPTGTSGFGTATVFGQSRTVFNFNGTNANADQSGLTYNAAGLLTPNSYSIALTLKFNERENAWRRIYDVTGRTSDSGFYVDPSNRLDVYPASSSGVVFNSGEYRNVVLTVDGSTVSGYADGSQSFTINTGLLTIGAVPLVFFADNIAGSGQGEWSSGSIAALRLYDGVLTGEEIASLNGDPFVSDTSPVPEPATWVMFIGGFGLIGAAARRRKVAISWAPPITLA